LFYARPNLIPHTSIILVCMPKKRMSVRLLQYVRLRARDADILNQINPAGPKLKTDPEKSTDPGPQSQLEGARRLVKFIFPRQHGLPNPFTISTENTTPFRDREIEAKGFMRTPKRINNALDFFEKLIWRHGKCGYKPLLNTACPSKVSPKVSQNNRKFMYMGFRSKATCRKQTSW
ncbi:hypothetical protein BDM02DRAFT_3097222, partial [Thelephora ganbajun]